MTALVDRLVSVLTAYSYSMADEAQLQASISAVLDSERITHAREVVAGPRDRFDFFCVGGVVIEAKIKGSLTAALRQVDRYLSHPAVTAVVLVTTRHWGQSVLERGTLHGKPFRVVKLNTAAF